MNANGTARILICANQMDALQELRRILAHGGREVDAHVAGAPDPDKSWSLSPAGGGRRPRPRPRRWTCAAASAAASKTASRPSSTSPTTTAPPPAWPATRPAPTPICSAPSPPTNCSPRSQALLRIKEVHDRLAEKTAEVHRINKRLQQAYQQIDQELELAQRIQSSFLPQTLPEVPDGRFAVHYVLCGRVGGDFYDVFRLDENHVGFYVADAMGHGVPASLLTIFVKKGVRPKEVFGQQYRLVPPGEVLGRLNKELDRPAIVGARRSSRWPTVCSTTARGRCSFARAGHPYPLYVPREGELAVVAAGGALAGRRRRDVPDADASRSSRATRCCCTATAWTRPCSRAARPARRACWPAPTGTATCRSQEFVAATGARPVRRRGPAGRPDAAGPGDGRARKELNHRGTENTEKCKCLCLSLCSLCLCGSIVF